MQWQIQTFCLRGGGEGGQSKKNCFSALSASVWSKNAVGGVGQAPAMDPPLTSMQWEYAFRPAATGMYALWHYHYVEVQFYPWFKLYFPLHWIRVW